MNSTKAKFASTIFTANDIKKGSKWIGIGQYYSGEITVVRGPQTSATLSSHYSQDDHWVKFDLPGHGVEECTVSEFLQYFAKAAMC